MTDYVESDGFIHFVNGANTVRLYCEKFTWRLVKKPKIYHYDAEINVGIPVYKKYIIATIEGIWINTTSKMDNYLNYLETWLDSGTVNFKFQYTIGGSFQKLDGVNTIFPIMPKNDLGNIEPFIAGDQEYYRIDKVVLELAGTPS